MSAPGLFDTDPREPLALVTFEPAAPERIGLEFSSRGDRVTAQLSLPRSRRASPPLVLVAGEDGDASTPTPGMESLLEAGAAVLRIDLPLQGERSNPKFGLRLLACVEQGARGETLSTSDGFLWHEYLGQSLLDLRRALDAIAQLAGVVCEAVAYAGFGLGALLGPPLLSADQRPCAAALVGGGGGFGPREVDPCAFAAALAPRPLLLLNAKRGSRIPRQAAESLASAASAIRWKATGRQRATASWHPRARTDLFASCAITAGAPAVDDAEPAACPPRRGPAAAAD